MDESEWTQEEKDEVMAYEENFHLRERVRRVVKALRELYDCQNRTPLPGRREKAWNEAMAIAGKILMESQNVDE